MTIYIFEHVDNAHNYYKTERRSERDAWEDLKENHAHPNLGLVTCKKCKTIYDNQETTTCPECEHNKSTKVNWKKDWILQTTIRSWRSPKKCIDQKDGPVGCHKRFWNGKTESYLCYHDMSIPNSCLRKVYKLVSDKKRILGRFLSEKDAWLYLESITDDSTGYSVESYGGEEKNE